MPSSARILFVVLAIVVAACSESSQSANNATGCDAANFTAANAASIPLLFRNCGTRTLPEAESLASEYGDENLFFRPAGEDPTPVVLLDATEKTTVLICNLSPNRGVVGVPELQPVSQVINGRSCTPFEGVTNVVALAGRLASDPRGNGESGGAEEWFGVALIGASEAP